MDPRRRTYDPRTANKRPSSRSPDARAHKVAKPNDGALSRNANAPTRQPSMSSDPTRPLGGDPRHRPAVQIQSELRNHADGSTVSSPDSLGSKRSHYEDAPSGRSTALSANGTVAMRNASLPAPLGRDIGRVNQNADPKAVVLAAENNIYEKLMSAFSHVDTLAQSALLKNQASVTFDRAANEYENMQNQFANFPIIKEQKTFAKTQAEDRLKGYERTVEAETAVQRRLVKDLATLISQALSEANATKPAEPVMADFVPRSEFEALEKQLKSQVSTREERINMLQKNFEERVSKFEKSSEGRISKLETNVASTGERIDNATKQNVSSEKRLLKVEKQFLSSEERVQTIEKRVKSSDDVIDKVANQVKLATAKGDTSQATLVSVQEKVSGIDKKVSEVREELKTNLDETCQARHDKLYQEGQEIVANVKNALAKIEALEKAVQTGKPILPTAPTEATSAVNLGSIEERLAKLEFDMDNENGFIPSLEAAMSKGVDEVHELIGAIGNGWPEDGPEDEQGWNDLKAKMAGLASVNDLNSSVLRVNDHIEKVTKAHRQNINDDMKELGAQLAHKATKQSVDELTRDFKTQLAGKADEQKMADRMDDIRSRLGNKAAQSSLETAIGELKNEQREYANGVEAAYVRLDSLTDSIQKLQNQMESSATQVTQQPNGPSRLATPNRSSTPSNGPSAPVNGLAQSNGTPVNNVPQPNGGPVMPPLDIQQQFKKIAEKHAFYDMKHEALSTATISLEDRYNNLTTDVVVQAMVDEMSKMYPDAKNTQKALYDLKNLIQNLDQRLRNLDERANKASKDALDSKSLAGEVGKTVNGIKSAVEESKTKYEALQKQLVAVNQAVLANSQQAGKTVVDVPPALQNTVQELQRDVDLLQKKINVRTTEPSAAQGVTQSTIDGIKGKLQEFQTQMLRLNRVASNAETALNSIEKVQTALNEVKDKVSSTASTTDFQTLKQNVAKAVDSVKTAQAASDKARDAQSIELKKTQSSLSVVSGKVDKHEQRLTFGETSITKLEGFYQEVKAKVVEHGARIDSLDATRD